MPYMTTHTYAVTGMTCDHCVAAVTSEVSRIEGISEVVVDLSQGTLAFTGEIPREAIADAVEEAGYELA
jgi:copper chaperone